MKQKYDLVVIGGGVLGAFSAMHALNLGYKVALLERNRTPRQATVRNFGQIVPSGLSQDWLKYGVKSLEIYNALDRKGDFTIRKEGSYYLASDPDEQTLLEELYVINQQTGYPCELLTRQQVRESQPGIKPEYVKQALYFPEEISVDPRQMVARVLDFLQETKGLDYFPYHLAVGVDRTLGGTIQVSTSNKKKFNAEKVLICSGAEVQTLMPEAFPEDEIECSLLHMVVSKPQPQKLIHGNLLSGLSVRRYESFRACPSYEAIKNRENISGDITENGIHILFKQEPNGQLVIGDSHHYAPTHHRDDLGFDFDRKIEDLILREAKKILTPAHWSIDKVWTGIYSQTRTGAVYEKDVEENIHILTGIGGKGMTASPGYTFEFIQKIFADD